MLSRTTTSVVTFLHPFVVAGYTDELPAGENEVSADDDVMLSRCLRHTDYGDVYIDQMARRKARAARSGSLRP